MSNYELLTLEQIMNDEKKASIQINIPNEELERLISLLQKEVKKDIADFELMNGICWALIQSFPSIVHIYKDTFILRARPNFNDEIFDTSSQLSYNKTHPDLITLNRFNLDKEAVFYGAAPINSDKANGALTTIIESFKKLVDNKNDEPKQILTLGKWMVKKPIHLFMLTFNTEAWEKSIHVQNVNHAYVDFIEKCQTNEDRKKLVFFYTYFSECAGKKNDSQNNYLLTTAFFHALQEFYGHEIGIIYSSSMTDNYGLSMVLPKEILDANYLELHDVVMYKCLRNPQKRQQFKIYPFKVGFNKGDKFDFNNYVDSDIKTQYFSLIECEKIISKYEAEIKGRNLFIDNKSTIIVSLKKVLQTSGYEIIVVTDCGIEERIEKVLGLLYVQDDEYFDKFL